MKTFIYTAMNTLRCAGLTPLGQAVVSQQMAAVKRLVKMGADINAQDGIGRTCLSIAAYQVGVVFTFFQPDSFLDATKTQMTLKVCFRRPPLCSPFTALEWYAEKCGLSAVFHSSVACSVMTLPTHVSQQRRY